jgi:hypothetical protein
MLTHSACLVSHASVTLRARVPRVCVVASWRIAPCDSC